MLLQPARTGTSAAVDAAPVAAGGAGADSADGGGEGAKGSAGDASGAVDALVAVRRFVKRELRVDVPAAPPRTYEEYETQKKVWPVVFHRNVHAEAPELPEEERSAMLDHLRGAVEVARRGEALGYPAIGAVVVDSETGKVVATEFDRSRWCAPAGTADPQPESPPHGVHPLMHATMLCIDAVAAWHRRARGLPTTQPDCGPSATFTAEATVDGAPPSGAYLCTGLDLYITREPCSMCAMALVHSRIRRVVYGTPSPVFGALGSALRVHGEPTLNHHYRVWKVDDGGDGGEVAATCAALRAFDSDDGDGKA